MGIDCLGANLNILINCQNNYMHDWASFASWYSISKMAPDANVSILRKGKSSENELFVWARKIGVNFSRDISCNTFLMLGSPYVNMVREFDSRSLIYLNSGEFLDSYEITCVAKSDNCDPFVDYAEGCGNFVVDEWINTLKCPLEFVDQFMSHEANVNEVKVLSLWKQAHNVYSAISRGG